MCNCKRKWMRGVDVNASLSVRILATLGVCVGVDADVCVCAS